VPLSKGLGGVVPAADHTLLEEFFVFRGVVHIDGDKGTRHDYGYIFSGVGSVQTFGEDERKVGLERRTLVTGRKRTLFPDAGNDSGLACAASGSEFRGSVVGVYVRVISAIALSCLDALISIQEREYTKPPGLSHKPSQNPLIGQLTDHHCSARCLAA
jgi:hypothetical protein